MTFRYLSVCSGIEAASVAWHPIGWEPAAFSEIEAFPRAVLKHHFPHVPCHGDFTTIEGNEYGPIDLLVGGTPCQDGSVGYSAGAGVRGDGFYGKRTGLAFGFVRLIHRLGCDWFVWENVPNLLTAGMAKGFLHFAGQIADIGYHCAWRVLDARGFGMSDQPRRRIIMVGHREPGRAAAVLFEPEGAERNCQPKAQTAPVLTARGGVALDDRTPCILDRGRPRIATPLEWERAMGFPDNWTRIPYRGKSADRCPDKPRYHALGNSMDVRVMRWVGERIHQSSVQRKAA